MKGQAIFVCPECGEHFTSVDIDYRNSDHAIPMACPQCGTRTLDKYWNQTSIPDWGIYAIILACLILPYVIWRLCRRLIYKFFYKIYVKDYRTAEEKQDKTKKK